MIKGVQRKMIVLKPDKESAFETAYFILRTDIAETDTKGEVLVLEANKLIAENRPTSKRKKQQRRERVKFGVPFFLFGFISGLLFLSVLLCILVL